MKGTGSITIAAVALLLAASTAQAQFPGGGMGGMGRRGGEGERGQRGAIPAPPSRTDVERQDPILVLVANRSALALSDSEMTRLEALDAGVMERNRPLLAQYDSLLALIPTASGEGAAQDEAQEGGARAALFAVLREVRGNYQDAGKQALALLADDQRGKATKLLDALRPKGPAFGDGERPERGRP